MTHRLDLLFVAGPNVDTLLLAGARGAFVLLVGVTLAALTRDRPGSAVRISIVALPAGLVAALSAALPPGLLPAVRIPVHVPGRPGPAAAAALGLIWLVGAGVLVLRGRAVRSAVERLWAGAARMDPELIERIRSAWPSGTVSVPGEMRVAPVGGAAVLPGAGGGRLLLSPEAFDLPDADLALLLRHEAAHRIGRDLTIRRGAEIVRAVLWPLLPVHPLVHGIVAHQEREADRRVLDVPRKGRAGDRSRYARLLHAMWKGGPLPRSFPSFASGRLAPRLRSLGRTRGRSRIREIGATLLLLVTVVASTAATAVWRIDGEPGEAPGIPDLDGASLPLDPDGSEVYRLIEFAPVTDP